MGVVLGEGGVIVLGCKWSGGMGRRCCQGSGVEYNIYFPSVISRLCVELFGVNIATPTC